MEIYKSIKCTLSNGANFEINIFNNSTITLKTTMNMRPKNRKQKKLWKKESAEFKKINKGLYSVTQVCSSNLEAFIKMITLLDKDEHGNIGFNLEKNE